jgi:hypothetical protein
MDFTNLLTSAKVKFPCYLINKIPEEGIVIVHHNALRFHRQPLSPSSKLLFIYIKAESTRSPYAQIQVVQNPEEANPQKSSYYLPHWSQPGLVPRSEQRGDCLINIAYFGHDANLASELKSPDWQIQLENMGLRWLPIINRNSWHNFETIDNRWNDYSQIDAILAVRSFQSGKSYFNKPATKLYSAWLAGVPALLGPESAYRYEGEKGLNYLEVNSVRESIAALELLQNNFSLRNNLIKNGTLRGKEFQPDKIRQKWQDFLLEVAVPAFEHWISLSRWEQKILSQKNFLLSLEEKIQEKFVPRWNYFTIKEPIN